MGLGLIVDVKDVLKLQASLEALMKSLPLVIGDNVSVKKHKYAGTEMYTLHLAQECFFFVPSFTVHQGRLVVSLFPQTVRGYLLRSSG